MTVTSDKSGPVSETELKEKAVAPRVTEEALEANILAEYFFTADHAVGPDVPKHESLKLLTFCVLVLKNGYTVHGISACASPENFNPDIGARLARQDARNKIWSLMGYELRSQLQRPVLTDERFGEALTRMLAHRLGNPEAFRAEDAELILDHFEKTGSEGDRS